MTSVRPRCGRRNFALLAMTLPLGCMTGGCSTVEPRPLAPALFPAAPGSPGPRDATRLALSLENPTQSFTNPAVRMRLAQVQLPLGRIVEAAAMLALGEQFESLALGPADDRRLSVRISDVAPDLTSDLIYVIPVPGGLIDRVDVTTRLAFRLTVTAPDGSARWSRDHDSGRELLKLKRENFFVQESLHEGIQRAFHEQAVRLMRQAAADLRGWLAQERLRERVL
jgi:hypothetical protein